MFSSIAFEKSKTQCFCFLLLLLIGKHFRNVKIFCDVFSIVRPFKKCVISEHNCVSIATVIKRFTKWMKYQAEREQIQSTEAKTEHRFNTHCWYYSSFEIISCMAFDFHFAFAIVNCELWIVKKAFLDDFVFYIFSYFFLGKTIYAQHLTSYLIFHLEFSSAHAVKFYHLCNIQHNRNNTNKHGTNRIHWRCREHSQNVQIIHKAHN